MGNPGSNSKKCKKRNLRINFRRKVKKKDGILSETIFGLYVQNAKKRNLRETLRFFDFLLTILINYAAISRVFVELLKPLKESLGKPNDVKYAFFCHYFMYCVICVGSMDFPKDS